MTGRSKQPFWILPLISAGLVAVFGWWGNARLRETIHGELRAKLTATLNANVTALEIWTTNQIRLATSLANEPDLCAIAVRILEGPAPMPEVPGRRPLVNTNLEELRVYLRPRLNPMGYEVAQIVNTNFTVVASSFRVIVPISESQTNRFAELFANGQPILIAPFKPQPSAGGRRIPQRGGRPGEGRGGPFGNRSPFRAWTNEFGQRRRGDVTAMQVAAPIRDAGVVRGALALIINPTNEFTRILSVARPGDSGETYAFDQTGLLLSRSRFDAQLRELGLLSETNTSSALNLRLHDPGRDLSDQPKPALTNLALQPLIHLVDAALNGEDNETVDVLPSRDYRGVPVVGASRWLPQLGFGVATQIDSNEAYRPLRVLRLIFTALFLLLVLCAMGLFLFSYANVTSRRRLSEAELKLKQLGQYTLEEKIGEGGMGVVYRARHALMRRETAVKLLLADRANETAIQRFEREVQLTCQLTHPNTIQVYDYGHTPEGTFYYAMEFLHGLNLHQLVTRFGPQPEGRVVHILTQICDSLAEAHALGLVHRDIKPANVFLCERGGVPDRVKVLDFGLVREYSTTRVQSPAPLTATEEFVGTPLFLAPEAMKDSTNADPRSDLYSVAALGYFLLTAKYAFESRSILEIYEQQMSGDIPSPSRRTDNPVSPQIEATLLRCLDKDPAKRPQSAAELRRLLLTSPLASAWDTEAAAAWWAMFRQQLETAEPDAGSASPIPTMKIDFGSRIK